LRANSVNAVADVGTGDGRNLLGLCQAGFSCTGVDISPTALTLAANTLTNNGHHAFLIEASFTALPFARHTVDAITCFDCFGQIADSLPALSEFRRVLKPRGLLFLNAFAIDDGTYGEGVKVAEHTFEYKDTTFRYHEEQELRNLLTGWELLNFERVEWDDPPHGDFRPYPHRHINHFVVVRSKALE
jgi:ubiquinone/menaquinone biosynthesis C-methylase UbiE